MRKVCRLCGHDADEHGYAPSTSGVTLDRCDCCETIDHNGQPIEREEEEDDG